MRMGLAYINYRRHAKSRHGVHSPFVYDLIDSVLNPKASGASREIENLRSKLLKNNNFLKINDLGAGSKSLTSANRRIGDIAKASATKKSYAAMLQRLIAHYRLKNVLELGTNLGITTAYLASAKNQPNVISLEGDANLANLAAQNLESLGLKADIRCGAFEGNIESAIASMPEVDFAYLDGNHRRAPTLAYFQNLLPALQNESIVAIGDIHWSEEMEAAWAEIKNHPSVRVTVDIFYLGLVFFKKELAHEHFTLKF